MGWLRKWRRSRAARRYRPSAAAWARAEAALPRLRRLDPRQRERLGVTAAAFIDEKRFEGLGDVTLEEPVIGAIALQAAVPVLELGLDWYAPWTTVLLYPAGFVARHEYEDEDGIVHVDEGPLIGEAWEGGPLVLSVEDALEPDPGTCVVIHECAHKLDMGQGSVNGLPPLPRGMSVGEWSAALEPAFRSLGAEVARTEDLAEEGEGGRELPLDPYAAEDPGEFFAVVSETYFTDPRRLRRAYPAVHGQLVRFYGWEL